MATNHTTTALQALISLAVVAALSACGADKKAAKPGDSTGNGTSATGGGASADSALPDLATLDLAGMTGQSASLADSTSSSTSTGTGTSSAADSDCDLPATYGAGGMALSVACHANRIVEAMLYGKPTSAPVSCASYVPGSTTNPFLLSLLCNPDIIARPGLESVRFTQGADDVALSFADYDPTDGIAALGSWTATGADAGRYPANVRVWQGPTGGALSGVLGMNLSSNRQGTVFVDVRDAGPEVLAQLDFVGQTDTSGCQANPSDTTCHAIDLRLAGPEDGGSGHGPSSVRVRALGAAKVQPGFLIMEGQLRYSDAAAAASFGANPALPAQFAGIRKIYFRAIRSGSQIWGSYDLQDANGKTISAPVTIDGQTVDMGSLLRDGTATANTGTEYTGLCQNLGSPSSVACTDVKPETFSNVWEGDAKLTPVPVGFTLPAVFATGTPATDGVVTAP